AHRAREAAAVLGVGGQRPDGRTGSWIPPTRLELLEVVLHRLAADAARAGVEHEYGVPEPEPEHPGQALVQHLVHLLQLEEMVPRAEGGVAAPPLPQRLR